MSGVITSPNHPDPYPKGIECVWNIRCPEGRGLLLLIPNISLPLTTDCSDHLIMRKNASPFSKTTYYACESYDNPVAFISRSKDLYVKFTSKSTNEMAEGFKIFYVTFQGRWFSLWDKHCFGFWSLVCYFFFFFFFVHFRAIFNLVAKVIRVCFVFALFWSVIGPSRHLLNQSDTIRKPVVNWPPLFSCVFHPFLIFPMSAHWLMMMSPLRYDKLLWLLFVGQLETTLSSSFNYE